MRVPLYDIVIMAKDKMKEALREESFGAKFWQLAIIYENRVIIA